ncbi:beta-1,4-galactosyltransferase 1 [Elysia marginata]|uniref:Beta-1,4-galactosyltransferase n=1 Tax=Elysia marginata TaxID=1093978 RepID=A0AAV4GK29_9GAST|nr:beta-1,4-galactosyltransferase 1 [Elysia marginata]
MFGRKLRKKTSLLAICLVCSALFLMTLVHMSHFDRGFHYTSHITRSLQDLAVSDAMSYDSRFILVGRNSHSSDSSDLDTPPRDVAERLTRLYRHSPRAQQLPGAQNGVAKVSNRTGSNSEDPDRLPACQQSELSLKGRIKSPAYLSEWPLFTPQQMASMFPRLRDGGHYSPTSCRPYEKTAILIPYRDRWDHLHTMLPVLIPMLLRQQIDFTIYVIEQDSSTTYNKGVLFNAGFLEAVNADDYDCFVLHDVDMIPLDDRNIYKCLTSGPVHFSAGVDKFAYKYRFDSLASFSLWLFSFDTKPCPSRFKVFAQRLKRQDVDGLNSVVYSVTNVGVFPIYTWISVKFDPEQILKVSRGEEGMLCAYDC